MRERNRGDDPFDLGRLGEKKTIIFWKISERGALGFDLFVMEASSDFCELLWIWGIGGIAKSRQQHWAELVKVGEIVERKCNGAPSD